ncbi:nicotinate phosphoribosyltransferase [Pseudoxanthomonas broegbernensis]|uniref:Nicotinate phosphoribosyltransferase n=1 Tax=Pseudoxanthomonas broegbernensis TaxID=83619 RepID=A0A7V8K7H3_9GAMM|nr:nicotinate phosphoribosyltransferase [Pseudoxanthomonas broegbernensis]KAF1686581.1 nicotinate phosphoribosyltransferase [Pseudoxanthomonas broegbernensis]MBB6063671.1 nicotinate phosphoribosyltransferase [Pseudoxanthomonas broegbernensis]
METIVPSLLDTDLYKFTMMQAVLHQHPGAQVEYLFRCRTPGVDLARRLEAISAQIDALCALRMRPEELDYLRGLRFLKPDFVDFLGLFHFDRKYVRLRRSGTENGGIELRLRGPWLHTILFEVPLLAIVSEVHMRGEYGEPDRTEGLRRLRAKTALLRDAVGFQDCAITDFGTRRRYSRAWHGELLPHLRAELGERFAGTSNVHFARKHGLVPQGTMAHEWLQAFQALGPRLRDSQAAAFDAWAREYRGDLGVALTDVIGLEAFLRDFDLYFCKLFDGMRHDSGDPVEWGERIIAHLRAHRIDPRTKTLVFSDGLDVERVMALHAHFRGRCRMSFGVGTHLTNDLGRPPLQIVLKMVRCNGQPVAKLSDTPGKTMVDDAGYLAYLRQVFEVPAPAPGPAGAGGVIA